LVDGYQRDDYYTAKEVAEIRSISKQAVIEGCKRGQYDGVFQDQSYLGANKPWLIPKQAVDNPVMIHDVAVLKKEMSPMEIKNLLAVIVSEAVSGAMEGIQEELSTVKEQLEKVLSENENLKKQISEGQTESQTISKSFHQQLVEMQGVSASQTEELKKSLAEIGSRLERKPEKKGIFSKLFGG